MLAGSCKWSAVSKYQNGMPKVAKKAFNMGEVGNPVWCRGNRTVKLILWRTFRRILLQKIKNIWCLIQIGWYLFLSYLNKIWLSVWRHHSANLHILKTPISLERKEIFEKSKQRFSSHADFLFMFQNGLEAKYLKCVLLMETDVCPLFESLPTAYCTCTLLTMLRFRMSRRRTSRVY